MKLERKKSLRLVEIIEKKREGIGRKRTLIQHKLEMWCGKG